MSEVEGWSCPRCGIFQLESIACVVCSLSRAGWAVPVHLEYTWPVGEQQYAHWKASTNTTVLHWNRDDDDSCPDFDEYGELNPTRKRDELTVAMHGLCFDIGM